jgi:hypothetical protein
MKLTQLTDRLRDTHENNTPCRKQASQTTPSKKPSTIRYFPQPEPMRNPQLSLQQKVNPPPHNFQVPGNLRRENHPLVIKKVSQPKKLPEIRTINPDEFNNQRSEKPKPSKPVVANAPLLTAVAFKTKAQTELNEAEKNYENGRRPTSKHKFLNSLFLNKSARISKYELLFMQLRSNLHSFLDIVHSPVFHQLALHADPGLTHFVEWAQNDKELTTLAPLPAYSREPQPAAYTSQPTAAKWLTIKRLVTLSDENLLKIFRRYTQASFNLYRLKDPKDELIPPKAFVYFFCKVNKIEIPRYNPLQKKFIISNAKFSNFTGAYSLYFRLDELLIRKEIAYNQISRPAQAPLSRPKPAPDDSTKQTKRNSHHATGKNLPAKCHLAAPEANPNTPAKQPNKNTSNSSKTEISYSKQKIIENTTYKIRQDLKVKYGGKKSGYQNNANQIAEIANLPTAKLVPEAISASKIIQRVTRLLTLHSQRAPISPDKHNLHQARDNDTQVNTPTKPKNNENTQEISKMTTVKKIYN